MQSIDIAGISILQVGTIKVQEDVLAVNPEIQSRVLHLLIYAQNNTTFLTAILASS